MIKKKIPAEAENNEVSLPVKGKAKGKVSHKPVANKTKAKSNKPKKYHV